MQGVVGGELAQVGVLVGGDRAEDGLGQVTDLMVPAERQVRLLHVVPGHVAVQDGVGVGRPRRREAAAAKAAEHGSVVGKQGRSSTIRTAPSRNSRS